MIIELTRLYFRVAVTFSGAVKDGKTQLAVGDLPPTMSKREKGVHKKTGDNSPEQIPGL